MSKVRALAILARLTAAAFRDARAPRAQVPWSKEMR